MNKEDAEKQWQLCPICGAKREPNPYHVEKLVAKGWTQEDAEQYARQHGFLQCPNMDETRTKTMVPLEALEHGAYYHGTCRNAHVARWDAEKQHFVHWRTKFNNVFTETIGYWVEAQPGEHRFDEFKPFGKLENPPVEIPLD